MTEGNSLMSVNATDMQNALYYAPLGLGFPEKNLETCGIIQQK